MKRPVWSRSAVCCGQIVKNGDTDALKKMLLGPTPDYAGIGELSGETIKENEYLVVSVVTLMTRAAVAGGASAEAAHELGDVYLKRLAKAVLRNESFLGLSFNAMFEFTELVRRAREEKSRFSIRIRSEKSTPVSFR